ncbi:MAG: Nif3-like dinuclear metal center hexameric protein [Eubacteriales bacterium]
MTAYELYTALCGKIPASLSCEWDNDGLMCCPEPDKKINKALIALDITEKVTDYAVREGFDAIISHHPLIFHKLSALEPSSSVARKVIKLTKHNICAMSFHTRLDAADGGVNDVLASVLRLENVRAFGPENERIGRIGTLCEPMDPDDFCKMLREGLGSPAVLAALCGRKVHRVAVLGGDGKDFADAAVSEGADTYISGRISYNVMTEAPEIGINMIEAGHFFTENPVCYALSDMVKSISPDIETKIINSNEIRLY